MIKVDKLTITSIGKLNSNKLTAKVIPVTIAKITDTNSKQTLNSDVSAKAFAINLKLTNPINEAQLTKIVSN